MAPERGRKPTVMPGRHLTILYMKALLITAMLFSLFGCGTANGIKLNGDLEYYQYKSFTMRAYPAEYYRLEYTEGKDLTLAWARNSSPVTVIRVPAEAARKVTSLIEEYKLYNLKESYTPPFKVLDGISWNVSFSVGGKEIYSSGENAWPAEKIRDGIKAINACFGTLIDASKEEDVLEVREKDF